MSKPNPKNKKLNVTFLRRKPFVFIDKIFKNFKDADVYIVGGPVRDLLTGLEIKDCDFVVRNIPPRKLENFLKKLGKVSLVGKRFGVFKFLPKSSTLPEFDIALPRTEHSLHFRGGYKDFDIQSDPKLEIEKDLSRRDFTINAMAWDVKNKILIDKFNGLTDIKKKIIKTVGKPEDRFKEDYSRMLRAIRFTCQLGFEIDKNTFSAIKKMMPHINDTVGKDRVVPYEVIAKEMLKTFTCNPVKAFDYYDKSGAFKALMPEILKMKDCPQPKQWHNEGDVWKHTRLSLQRLMEPGFKKRFKDSSLNAELVIALLLHDIGKPYTLKTPQKDGVDRIRSNGHDIFGAKMAEKICRRLKLTSPADFKLKIENVVIMIHKHLILVHGDPMKMKNTTLEKSFFINPKLGQNLIKLIYADASATVPPSGKPDMKFFNRLIKRLKQLEKFCLEKEKLTLKKPLISGHDLIKTYKIKESPQIGKLLNILKNRLYNSLKNTYEIYCQIKRCQSAS